MIHARFVSLLALCTSVGTLVCCAIPAALVLLGFGSSLAALVSIAPGITLLSAYKEYVFGSAVILIVAALWMLYRQPAACPTDPKLAALCQQSRRLNRILILLACLLTFSGALVAFVLPVLL